VRDPHFRFRALDVSRSPEPLREWIAATGPRLGSPVPLIRDIREKADGLRQDFAK